MEPVTPTSDVEKSTPPKPLLPGDLAHRPDIWEDQGRVFRTSALCSVDLRQRDRAEGCRSNKIALINALSDDEWAYLYHYGFVPINTRISFAKYVRLHYRGGNNATMFDSSGRATTGKCCFILTGCEDALFLSQLLELRTRPKVFIDKACSSITVEERLDFDYCERRTFPKGHPLMANMSKVGMFAYPKDDDDGESAYASRIRAIAGKVPGFRSPA